MVSEEESPTCLINTTLPVNLTVAERAIVDHDWRDLVSDCCAQPITFAQKLSLRLTDPRPRLLDMYGWTVCVQLGLMVVCAVSAATVGLGPAGSF